MTTDPIVADPGSGQSWNPYSYVLNNPLAYTDPSGFAGETPDGSTLVDLPGGYGLSYKAPPPIGPPPPVAPKVIASQVGLGKAPGNVGVTGEQARPEEEPTADGPPPGMAARVRTDRMPGPPGFDPSFGKSGVEIGAEVGRGALSGIGGAVGDALSIDLLHVPTGLFRIVGDAWASGDPVGGLSAIFWEPGRAQVDQVVASAVEGDFEGAAEAGVKAITVGVATGVVIGEIGGAGVEAAEEVERGVRGTGSRRPSPSQRERIFDKSKDVEGVPRCVYCSKEITPTPGHPNSYEADHQQPWSRGGPTTDENLAPACRTCNRSKGAKTRKEFKK